MKNIITKQYEIVIITQNLCLLFIGYFFTFFRFHPLSEMRQRIFRCLIFDTISGITLT